MAAGHVLLSTVPRSHGPSPNVELRQPRQLEKHGRQYSIQLDIDDKPVGHADGESEEGSKVLPPLPAAEPDHASSLSLLPAKNSPLREKIASQGETPVSPPGPSPEELFARRFGYSPSGLPPLPSDTTSERPQIPLPRPRPRSIQRHQTPFNDDDEGNLVELPSPPLLRPASFWRNTRRSALHTPSLHLVRRATFLAAGLALDKPVCDLSAYAVESRITVGKTRGLGGSAGVPIGWGVLE